MNKLFGLFLIAAFTNEAFGQGVFNIRQNQLRGQNRCPWQNLALCQNPQTKSTPSPTTDADRSITSTTLSPEIRQCIKDCPVTPEYNPVCGTNHVTYDNPGRLKCAQWCGVDVTFKSQGRCPPPPDAE